MRVRVGRLGDLLTVKPVKKHGRVHTAGTVMLMNAFVMDGSFVGDMQHEAMEVLEPTHPVLLKKLVRVELNDDRYLTVSRNPHERVDVTDGHFSVAYLCGSDFYVTREW